MASDFIQPISRCRLARTSASCGSHNGTKKKSTIRCGCSQLMSSSFQGLFHDIPRFHLSLISLSRLSPWEKIPLSPPDLIHGHPKGDKNLNIHCPWSARHHFRLKNSYVNSYVDMQIVCSQTMNLGDGVKATLKTCRNL